MFKLEMIELLNKYSKTVDDFEIKKIENSISNLILENNEQFNNFIATTDLDLKMKRILKQCSLKNNKIKEEEENQKQKNSTDFEIIKKYYYNWIKNYNENNFKANIECEKIILEIINFYAPNRFEVLKKILEIKDSTNFEKFQNMLNNYLRTYFSDKIMNYFESENFEKLGFFEKRKRKSKILKILNQIGEYNFDVNQINKIFE